MLDATDVVPQNLAKQCHTGAWIVVQMMCPTQVMSFTFHIHIDWLISRHRWTAEPLFELYHWAAENLSSFDPLRESAVSSGSRIMRVVVAVLGEVAAERVEEVEAEHHT